MTTVTMHIEASPHQVYSVLSDGWAYAQWVVGTSHVRAVDGTWPSPGSRLHHAVGVWPLLVRDHTVVREVTPDHRLVLTARGWPMGEAEIDITLTPENGGTSVSLFETPTGGPGLLLKNPLGAALIYRRNVETLNRLAALAERRDQPVEGR